jgi:hypothetical protein
MNLQIPKRLLPKLITKQSGQLPPKYKLHLPHGLTYYAVEIDAKGTVTRIEGRGIFSAADLGFSTGEIEDIEAY